MMKREAKKMDTMEYVIQTIERLVNIPSPSGYTAEVMEFVKGEAESFGYQTEASKKGGLIITVPGRTAETVGLSAHVDTLGAMVRSVTEKGMLKLIAVGGFLMESVESSYCKIHTRDGRTYTGTILSVSPSVHSYDDARTLERTERNMEVRLDEPVHSKKDVEALGICAGDYISFDAGFVYLENGFVKSRHLDDKASVGVLLGVLRELRQRSFVPEKTVKLVISNYEEVGHGASSLPEEIGEFIAVDMGAVGDDLNGDEYKVSICAKDSSGPYDYALTNRLISIAREKKLDYVVDVFPHYGSDVSAALRGGNNICGALIGQGVSASHSMERTHRDGLKNTLLLILGYLESR